MTGMEMMEALSFVDERYIAEADFAPAKKKHTWTKWVSLAACLGILLTGAWALSRMGVGGGAMESAPMEPEAPTATQPTPEAAPEAAPEAGPEAAPESFDSQPAQQEQKLIRTVSIEAETQSVGELIPWLDTLVAEHGGYYEEQYLGDAYEGSYHHTQLVIRVPEKNLDSFLDTLSGGVNILFRSETTENVTLQYTDTRNRVEMLKTEQKRLLELLETAEAMEDLLKIEEQLTKVRWELETYESQLRVLENQISYSTVHLSVYQVEEPTVIQERTVWEKIRDGFLRNARSVKIGLEDTFVWLTVRIPYLLPLGLIAGAGLLILWLIRKRRK